MGEKKGKKGRRHQSKEKVKKSGADGREDNEGGG